MGDENQVTVKGKILFREGAPENLPKPSQLHVKFQDTSRMDEPSIMISEYKSQIEEFTKDSILEYSIKAPRPTTGCDFRVSAVINVGWVAEEEGKQWLRIGDYLNDTAHHVELKEGQTEYTKDIKVKLHQNN